MPQNVSPQTSGNPGHSGVQAKGAPVGSGKALMPAKGPSISTGRIVTPSKNGKLRDSATSRISGNKMKTRSWGRKR